MTRAFHSVLCTDFFKTNLISHNGNGTGSGDLLLSKPHRGKIRRNTKNKNCGDWAHKLPNKGDGEQIRTGTASFHPSPDAVKGRPSEHYLPDTPVIQEPEDGQNKWDVGEQVDQRQPVDSQRVDAVEAHEYVTYDAILEPHESVAGRDGAEEEQHEPAAAVKFGFSVCWITQSLDVQRRAGGERPQTPRQWHQPWREILLGCGPWPFLYSGFRICTVSIQCIVVWHFNCPKASLPSLLSGTNLKSSQLAALSANCSEECSWCLVSPLTTCDMTESLHCISTYLSSALPRDVNIGKSSISNKNPSHQCLWHMLGV